MPNQTTPSHPTVWDERKSIALTRLVTAAVFLVCIAVAVGGPAIVDWLITRGRITIGGPAVRWVMLALGYLLAAPAFWLLYHLDRFHNMPAALVIQDPDPVLVAGAIIMELPMVDKVDPAFYEAVKDGDMVAVNADEGYVEIED